MTSSKIPSKYARILMRADGSSAIGMGHVVRSLVLARELLDLGAEVEVWGSLVCEGKALVQSCQPVPIVEFAEPAGGVGQLEEIRSYKPDLVVADGYHFQTEFFEALDKQDTRYGVIDDTGKTEANFPLFVVNQNPTAERSMYEKRFPTANLFLGLEYALIRREVWGARNNGHQTSSSVLLSLGGSDPLGLTLVLADALSTDGWEVTVVLGPATRDRSKLENQVAGLQGVKSVSAQQLTVEMARAEICVLAAGSTLWEANALGKRTFGIIVADNQVLATERALEIGILDGVLDARNGNFETDLIPALLESIKKPKVESQPEVRLRIGSSRLLARSLLGSHTQVPRL